MTKTDHLTRAKDATRIAESDDSKREAWLVVQSEIKAAIAEGAKQVEVARFIGKSTFWVSTVVLWDPITTPVPFSQSAEARPSTRYERQVPKITRENPEIIVAAIKAAPTEVQEAIAEGMARDEVLAVPVATAAVKVSNELGEKVKGGKHKHNAWTRIGGRFNTARYGAILSLSEVKEDGGLDLPDDMAADLIAQGERVVAAYELLLASMRGGGIEEIEAFLAAQEA